MDHTDGCIYCLQVASDYVLLSVSPEAMLRANEASFTLSFRIMDVVSPVDHEIVHAIKQARREKPLSNKGSQPWMRVPHHSLPQRQSNDKSEG